MLRPGAGTSRPFQELSGREYQLREGRWRSLSREVRIAGPEVTAGADAVDVGRRAKRGDFDAGTTIACSHADRTPRDDCEAEVARDGDGTAAVVVTFSNGFRRTLFFREGTFLRGDATMSGIGTDTESLFVDGIYLIRVDDQRFEVPVSLIMGQ